MGKRSAVVELFLGDMGSIQRETRPSIQREDQLTMETKLEQIAAKCCEPTAEERWCGKSARHVLWEPGAGDRLRRPGGREVTRVPTASLSFILRSSFRVVGPTRRGMAGADCPRGWPPSPNQKIVAQSVPAEVS